MKNLIIISVLSMLSIYQVNKNSGIFILSLTRYFQWPIEKNEKFFRIAVYGNFNFYKEISESTLGKNVGSLNIEVSQINRLEEITILKPHILVITNEKCTINSISQIKKLTKDYSTIIICTKKGSLNQGADVELIIEDDKLNFFYNKESIANKGIRISKQLDIFLR